MLLGDYLAYTNVISRKWSFDKEYTSTVVDAKHQ